MYKMLCFDLDGTLLKSDKTISPRTSKLIKEIASQGIKIVIATGRHLDYAIYLTRDLPADRVIISNNGAGIFDINKGRTLRASYIPDFIANDFIDISASYKADHLIYVNAFETGFDLYSISDIFDDYIGSIVRNEDRIKKLDSRNLSKILALVATGPIVDLRKIQSYLEIKHKDNITSHIMNSLYDKYGLLEIMVDDTSKWKSIKAYADSLGISEKQIIAFGDEINDIEMIRHAGLGVVMKNAIEAIRPYGNVLSEYTNDEDGVYHELVKIYEDGKNGLL